MRIRKQTPTVATAQERYNLELPPANLAFQRFAKAIRENEQAHASDIIACLCFVHYTVTKKGKNNFFYELMKKLGALDVLSYNLQKDAEWADQVAPSTTTTP